MSVGPAVARVSPLPVGHCSGALADRPALFSYAQTTQSPPTAPVSHRTTRPQRIQDRLVNGRSFPSATVRGNGMLARNSKPVTNLVMRPVVSPNRFRMTQLHDGRNFRKNCPRDWPVRRFATPGPI